MIFKKKMNFIKYSLQVSAILLLIITLSACNLNKANEFKQQKTEKEQNIGKDTIEQDYILITREEAELDTIERFDFSKFKLNERISQIIKDDSVYRDEDYSNGLQMVYVDNPWNSEVIIYSLIITERFEDNIIDNISIGTNMKKVKELLGTPSFGGNKILAYKTNRYYIAFQGTERVEQIAISNNPNEYDKEILKQIIEELIKNNSLASILKQKDIRSFFEKDNEIGGGGWYAKANNGIYISEFNDENYITIYNNYEGNLYKFNNSKLDFKIKYENQDEYAEDLMNYLKGYVADNELFEKEGDLSPTGKYNIILKPYRYGYEYAIVRTTDYSKPDYKTIIPGNEYKWINDDYIVCVDCQRFTIDIKNINPEKDNNDDGIIFEYDDCSMELHDKGIGFTSIEDVKEDVIIIKDRDNNIHRFKYEIKK